jgi:hypothetical protein
VDTSVDDDVFVAFELALNDERLAEMGHALLIGLWSVLHQFLQF